MIDIMSEFTRIAFRESYVRNSLLSEISKNFDEAGVMQTYIPIDRVVLGERRRLVEEYYCSVDWKSSSDVQKVLKAYEKYLLRLFSRNKNDEHQKLIKYLEDDGFRYSRGEIEFPAKETPNGDSGELKITVTEFGNMRREIFRFMDLAEGRSNRDKAPNERVSQLSRQGFIPRNIANLMHTIIGFRNIAEYENHELSQEETGVVNNAWREIGKWVRGKGWE